MATNKLEHPEIRQSYIGGKLMKGKKPKGKMPMKDHMMPGMPPKDAEMKKMMGKKGKK